MKKPYFLKLLKLASLLNIYLYLFPVFILVKYIIFETTRGMALSAITALFSMYLGLGVTAAICKKEYYFTTKLLSYAAVLIPAAACALAFSRYGTGWSLLEVLTVGTFYFIGVNAYPKSYGEVFNGANLYAGSFLLAIYLMVVSNVGRFLPLRNTAYIAILLFILISMLIKSEENVEQVFFFRGVEIPEVQKTIRKHNVKAVTILFAGILLLFKLKDILSVILKFIFVLYLKILVFILYILSVLYPSGSGQTNANGKVDLPPNQPSDSNPFLDYLFKAVFIVLLIYIAYKTIPKLIKAILKFVSFIKAWLLKKMKVDNYKYEDEECVDIIEFTKQTAGRKLIKRKKSNLTTALRKATNPADKIRLMYAIIVNEIKLKGVEIANSDTTGQIAEKITSSRKSYTGIENVTSIYDKVRYGEEIPQDKTVIQMEQAMKSFTGKMGK